MYRILATQPAASPVCTVYYNMLFEFDVVNPQCKFVTRGGIDNHISFDYNDKTYQNL
jgi:hypothetical protein